MVSHLARLVMSTTSPSLYSARKRPRPSISTTILVGNSVDWSEVPVYQGAEVNKWVTQWQ
jgi:hypothetical protein